MAHPSETGRKVAHYEIGERIGSGGMGEVYRARDTRLKRDVAIKVLPKVLAADEMRLARFEQEARAASGLNHPNIVTIHEIGTTDGLPYIVMELVDGLTLRDKLALGRPLPRRELLDYATQAAEGIAKAHAAGIVHRDLKPENVMVTRDGFVKILDFGLAKLAAGTGRGIPADPDSPTASSVGLRSPETGTGAILGTAGYMSPEQARGGGVDFRSDQFSFGSILYEMVTGRRAFKRESYVQTLAAIIEVEPTPIPELNPAAPEAVCRIVERCLKKAPRDRYDSTLDLARDLRQEREHARETVTPPVPGAPAPKRSWWGQTALSVTASLAFVAVALGGPWVKDRVWPSLPAERRLAVLPFANASADPESQVFCDGLVEVLTRKLGELEQFPGSLWVAPAPEVRAAGVATAPVAKRALGVNLVLTGSVQRSGDRVRLSASLVDTTTLRQLRTMTLDSKKDELATLEDGVVKRLAEMLEFDLSPPAGQVLAAGRTGVGGAWDLYIQGRGHIQRYESEESLNRAISTFQAALQKDPTYALAYAGLGEAHALRYRLTKDPQSVELARKACARALEINDLLTPVHVTLGVLHTNTGEPEAAVKDLERALALDPASAEAMNALGQAQQALGHLEDAEATYRRAIGRAPSYWGYHSWLGQFLFRRGRYAEAEKEFRRVIELTPDNARGYASLGGVLLTVGRDAEAAKLLERSLLLRPNYAAASNLGSLYFDHRDYAGAVRALEQGVKFEGSDYRVWRSLAAAYYWAPGQRGKAAAAYREAAKRAQDHLAVDPRDANALVALADCRAMLGEPQTARQALENALDLAAGDIDIMQNAGSVYEQLGDRPRALVWVNRALQAGYPIQRIERDPSLQALRLDPGFGDASHTAPSPGSGEGPNGRRKP